MNDLQFLTGPSVADIDGVPGEEVVAGSASLDLQAYNAAGAPVGTKWPKLTSDWMVAHPAVGGFGDSLPVPTRRRRWSHSPEAATSTPTARTPLPVRQFVRKVSGYRKPSAANEDAFDEAVAEVAAASKRLLEAVAATHPHAHRAA